mmetsp:Transcript_32200/g.97318  ORF Transcript_32200/g.97318 Transcript_32200/m.97318 type:complete len:204 (+) Transcript_32200:133-744(+)
MRWLPLHVPRHAAETSGAHVPNGKTKTRARAAAPTFQTVTTTCAEGPVNWQDSRHADQITLCRRNRNCNPHLLCVGPAAVICLPATPSTLPDQLEPSAGPGKPPPRHGRCQLQATGRSHERRCQGVLRARARDLHVRVLRGGLELQPIRVGRRPRMVERGVRLSGADERPRRPRPARKRRGVGLQRGGGVGSAVLTMREQDKA